MARCDALIRRQKLKPTSGAISPPDTWLLTLARSYAGHKRWQLLCAYRAYPICEAFAGEPPGFLHTRASCVLPLVRYEISDIVALATEPCCCGLPFWRIANIEGRREEMLRLAKRGGGTVDVHAHRLRSPLSSTEGIRGYQFGQLPDGLEIAISLSPGVDADLVRHKLEHAIRETLSNVSAEPARISVVVVDAIARSGSGAKRTTGGFLCRVSP